LLLGVFLLVCAVAVYFLLSRDERHGPFWDKYLRVQYGMTQKEVEAVLGPAADEEDLGGIGADHCCGWEENGQRINIYFNGVRRDGEYGAHRKAFLLKTAPATDMWRPRWREVDVQQLPWKGG
jgi:hypothetical protein